jgi:hypothetical protein
VIANNSIRDTEESAIVVGYIEVVGNVVRRNRIHGAGEDGVKIDAKAKRTLVKRNLVAGSGDDGFDVKNPTTKLTANRALRNAKLGIQAVGGVIDAGANVAHGNGDRRQCTHISCT